jgi:predicted TIM-barrel fold metal-dependent hydrolase
MSTLVDCHVHVGSRDRWIPEGLQLADELAAPEVRALLAAEGPTGARLRDHLDAQGVDVAVAIPSGREAVQEYTLDEADGTDRILPFVQYDPRSAPDAARRFAAAIDAGARGLKVHPCSNQIPANDRSLYPLYAVAEERGIPVMVHVGSSIFPGAKMRYCDPLLVDEVAVDFPGLQVLCAHSGRGFWTQQVFELTRMRPNVWMELSGLPARRIASLFPELERVRDRVLFGSDWPSSPPISRLAEQFRELPFSDELIENALWRNAARLFELKLPADTEVN